MDMSNDSQIFRSKEQLEEEGWSLSGNVFRKNDDEYLPLYEAKMIHHFDHRWATHEHERTRDSSLVEKRNPNYTVLPRYWVAAREVYLRIANLPKGLLAALRSLNKDMTVLGVCHLLFIDSLGRGSGWSADVALFKVFPTWVEFVEQHPVARTIAPIREGLCGDNPACIEPLGPEYLPAEPLDEIKTGPRSSTAWYAVDPVVLWQVFSVIKRYSDFLDSVPPLRTGEMTLAFAEDLLIRASPRWLMGCRDITNSTNERTVMGSVFPFSAVGNNLPLWTAESECTVLLPAMLSSLACDFVTRFKVGGTHLNFFIAEQIPVLPPEEFDAPVPWGSNGSVRDWLLPRVLELTYTAWDLESFAADCGWDGPPFRWDEERRFLLRCELDAAFFHLYLQAIEGGDWRPARRGPKAAPTTKRPKS